jgi:hypothetical protein
MMEFLRTKEKRKEKEKKEKGDLKKIRENK